MEKSDRKILKNKPVDKGDYYESLQTEISKDVEGLDSRRLEIKADRTYFFDNQLGHVATIIKGQSYFSCKSHEKLKLEAFTSFFIPVGESASIKSTSGNLQILLVSAPSSQTVGKRFLLKNHKFVNACTNTQQSMRHILTEQYLSRRIFLRHDETLLSKSGDPISWHHTTMFDTKSLPLNEEKITVFRMSYNTKTEINICFDVPILSKVRFAVHPYSTSSQEWTKWEEIDSNTCYNLNESPDEMEMIKSEDGTIRGYRNKHEVHIPENGYVTLMCLFNPATTGIEKHVTGKFSDYGKGIDDMNILPFLSELSKYDQMVEELSIKQSLGEDIEKVGSYKVYQEGIKNQIAIEEELLSSIAERKNIVEMWKTKA